MDDITQRIHKFISDEVNTYNTHRSSVPIMDMDEFFCQSEDETMKQKLEYFNNENVLQYDDLLVCLVEKYDNYIISRVDNTPRNVCSKYLRMYTNYSYYINIKEPTPYQNTNTQSVMLLHSPNKQLNHSSFILEYIFPYFPQYNFTLTKYIYINSQARNIQIKFNTDNFIKYNFLCNADNYQSNNNYQLFSQFIDNEVRPYIQKIILPEVYLYRLSQMSATEQHKWMFDNMPNYKLSVLEEKEDKIRELEKKLAEEQEEKRLQSQLLETKDIEIKSFRQRINRMYEDNQNSISILTEQLDEKKNEIKTIQEQIFLLQNEYNGFRKIVDKFLNSE